MAAGAALFLREPPQSRAVAEEFAQFPERTHVGPGLHGPMEDLGVGIAKVASAIVGAVLQPERGGQHVHPLINGQPLEVGLHQGIEAVGRLVEFIGEPAAAEFGFGGLDAGALEQGQVIRLEIDDDDASSLGSG